MPKYKTGEEYYNKIYLVFNALIAFSLMPFVLIFLDIQKYGVANTIVNNELSTLLIIFLCLSYISLFYYSLKKHKKGISQIQMNSSLREKLNNYYSVSLKKYIELTICSFLMVIGLLLTKYFLFSIGYVFALIILSIDRPVLNSMLTKIPLTDSEKKTLKNKGLIDILPK